MAFAPDPIRDCCSLAWDIHRSGWGEQISANQEFQDFGNDIKGLAQNLNHITSVVDNAKAAWYYESQRLFGPGRPVPLKDWDLSSLNEILGNYQATLLDCKKILEENFEFRKNQNYAYNTEWNVVIQPRVDVLRKRLNDHNARIRILLKPLELHVLADVHRDLAKNLNADQRNNLHLHGLLIPNVEQAMREQARLIPIPIRIPVDVEKRFRMTAERVHPDSKIMGRFPLEAGANAFVTHFQVSTKAFVAGNFLNERTPLQTQYLALLKCVWIIRLISECDVLTIAPRDSQWPGYISQLNEDLSVECQRFIAPSAQRLIAPDLSTMRREEDFEIWPVQNIATLISPRSELCLEEVLKIPLPSQTPSIHRQISVFRLESSSKYRLVESVEDQKSATPCREEFKLDIDLKSLNLTPIYATPTSRPKALEICLTSSTTQINPTFSDMKHVLRLQHLLTGYKVFERYDQPMVTVSFFLSGHVSPVTEHGRLQLWLPHPFSAPSSTSNTASPSSSTPQSPISPSSFSSAMGSLNLGGNSQSGSSVNMGDSGRDDVTIGPTRPEPSSSRLSIRSLSTRIKNRTPSIMTNSSSTSRSTVTSTTTISTGNGRKAHLHMKPPKPMLVIFLKSQDQSAKLATVAIQIDDGTEVKRERCQCRNSSSKCRISCLERSDGDGHLLVQRWDASQGLGSWNLARLGMEQRKELPANAWNDVKRVSMKFEKFEDRYQFSGSPCSCNPKMQHDLARCVLDGHHGTFGVVKQIGSQRLKNYHQDRDDTAKKTMVMGSLAEEDCMSGREYGGSGGAESVYSDRR